MLDGIKKRLIHFESDGKSVVSDFVSARQRRVGALRRTVHACFYIQCAAALVCAVCGFAMGGIFTGLALAIGAAASVAAALMAVAGEPVIRLVSCALNLVYALICFIVSGNGAVFAVCGFVMLAASAAAAVSLAAGHLRDWLAAYPAARGRAGAGRACEAAGAFRAYADRGEGVRHNEFAEQPFRTGEYDGGAFG